jgi:hypothetical protein
MNALVRPAPGRKTRITGPAPGSAPRRTGVNHLAEEKIRNGI